MEIVCPTGLSSLIWRRPQVYWPSVDPPQHCGDSYEIRYDIGNAQSKHMSCTGNKGRTSSQCSVAEHARFIAN